MPVTAVSHGGHPAFKVILGVVVQGENLQSSSEIREHPRVPRRTTRRLVMHPRQAPSAAARAAQRVCVRGRKLCA